ncbi:hypothetical protein SUGI_0710900 [Cryptomeria japonica]|nr:hypothetical protein SUGI_0710900 [Cryptomeria japonica]
MAAASASASASAFMVICSPLSTPTTSNHEVDALIDVKKMILEDPSNALQTWNPSSPNPCKLKYVYCDAHGHVYTVHLALKNLSGALSPRIDLLNSTKLSGRVPRGKLSEFGYKSFQGNPDLCGDVLKKECPRSYP